MTGISGNIFHLTTSAGNLEEELFETLFQGREFRVERIVSTGHVTPQNHWYDQPLDEWVILLQGKATLEFEDGSKPGMSAGDYIFIPAHKRHRVSYTSCEPPCIWIAVHGKIET